MSEIRSISEGTFVIGDTNGLTFEAGPGISVSQPSEGTVRIGTEDDYIVTTEETVGTFTVNNTNDANISGVFSKAGYKPIAWTPKFGYSASVNFNDEGTYIENNELHFQGYAKLIMSGTLSVTFKLLITWVKIGGNNE